MRYLPHAQVTTTHPPDTSNLSNRPATLSLCRADVDNYGEPVARPRRGATEQAFERALRAARRAGRLDAVDGALIAAGRASARLVDDATDDGTVWMREAAIRRHVETLRELELTPGTRAPNPADEPLAVALASFMATEASSPNGHARP